MITFAKLRGTTFDDLRRRILKITQFGAKSSKESAPFGLDSNPIGEMTAIHATTSNIGESVVIGYIQRGQLAAPGETRLFSLDSEGNLSAFVWAKNNGQLLLNGDQNTAVRFAPLNAQLQAQVIVAVNIELTKIAIGITAAGGSYTPNPLQLDLSSAESPTVNLK